MLLFVICVVLYICCMSMLCNVVCMHVCVVFNKLNLCVLFHPMSKCCSIVCYVWCIQYTTYVQPCCFIKHIFKHIPPFWVQPFSVVTHPPHPVTNLL